MEQVPVGFVTFDDQLRLTYVNPTAERFWERPREELLGKVVWDLFPRISDPEAARAVRDFLASGTSVRFETLHEETGRWYEVHAHRTEGGYSASFLDVTERKQAEEALRGREAIMRSVAFITQHLLREGPREKVVLDALEKLGEALEVGRVAVFESEETPDGRILTSVNLEWAAPGLEPLSPRFQGFDTTALGAQELAARMQQGEAVERHAGDIPEREREVAEESDVAATLAVPLFAGERWLGALVIDSRGPRTWHPTIVDALTVAASALGAAIEEGRMRDALERSERDFRTLSENAPDLIIRVGTDLRHLHVNPETLRVIGRSREEVVGHHVRELELGDPLAREWEERLRQAIETGRGFVFSAWWPTVAGPRYFEAHGMVEQGPSGEVESVLVMARDLTERELTEQALRESEERFRFLADNAHDVVLRYRILPEPGFEYVSPSMTAITGYAPEELYADPHFWMKIVHPDDRHLLRPALNPPIEFSGPVSVRAIRKDGTIIWLELQSVHLRDGEGRVEAIHGIVRDVTERIRAEQQIRASLDALRVMDRQRRALVQRLVTAQEEERLRIANDIHDDSIQLMTAVGMRLAVLRNELRESEEAQSVGKLEETVQEAIVRLRNLIFELRPAALDREGLAPALSEYIETTHRDGAPSVSLHDKLEADPSSETRVLIYRLTQEALTNVRKHAKAAHIDVDLVAEHGGTHVTVRDDGVGFDPAAVKELTPGNVGLVSMRERAELAGGWFRVTSSPGAGTTVEFWIPEPEAGGLGPTPSADDA